MVKLSCKALQEDSHRAIFAKLIGMRLFHGRADFMWQKFHSLKSYKNMVQNINYQYIVTCISWYSMVAIPLNLGATHSLLPCIFYPGIFNIYINQELDVCLHLPSGIARIFPWGGGGGGGLGSLAFAMGGGTIQRSMTFFWSIMFHIKLDFFFVGGGGGTGERGTLGMGGGGNIPGPSPCRYAPLSAILSQMLASGQVTLILWLVR